MREVGAEFNSRRTPVNKREKSTSWQRKKGEGRGIVVSTGQGVAVGN